MHLMGDFYQWPAVATSNSLYSAAAKLNIDQNFLDNGDGSINKGTQFFSVF